MHDGWESDGDMVRSAYRLREDDDDFGQAGTLVRDVFSAAERDEFVTTVATALGGVTGDVRTRALEYWKNVDRETGNRIESKVRTGTARNAVEGMGESGDRKVQRAS